MNNLIMFSKKKLIIGVVILFAFIAAWGIWLQFLPEKTAPANYLFNVGFSLLFLYGGIVALYGAFTLRLRGDFGKSQLAFAIAFITQAVALWMWTYYNLILGVEIPYPSWADFFFLIFVPAAGIGTIYLVKVYKWEIKPRLIIESLIMLAVFAFIIFSYINKPDLSVELSLMTKILNISYPLSDAIIFVTIFAVLRVAGGRLQHGLYIFLFGFAVHSISDFLFTYRTAAGTYWNGDVSDMMLMTGGFLMSLGLIYIVASFKGSSEEMAGQSEVYLQ